MFVRFWIISFLFLFLWRFHFSIKIIYLLIPYWRCHIELIFIYFVFRKLNFIFCYYPKNFRIIFSFKKSLRKILLRIILRLQNDNFGNLSRRSQRSSALLWSLFLAQFSKLMRQLLIIYVLSVYFNCILRLYYFQIRSTFQIIHFTYILSAYKTIVVDLPILVCLFLKI